MTSDLDQTLSLKAQLNDMVTPVLRKIEQNTQTTSQALQQLVQAFEQASSQTGSSTGAMADRAGDNLDKLQTKLKETGGGFREFGEEAAQNSRKVGQALEDALYTKGSERRLDDLEQELGKVNQVFTSMASRQRSVSGRARVLHAISKDNINKKVIPAFQELHGTLDKYPDTLEEVNKLEEERMKMLDSGGKTLGRVEERIKGISGAFNEIKFGFQDAAALVTGSAMGAVGMEVQEQQRNVGRIAGVQAFTQVPGQLKEAQRLSQTTLENIQPLLEATKEFHAVSNEAIPAHIAQMYTLQKATGMAADEVVLLKDEMIRLGGMKEPAFLEIMDQTAFLAQQTNADQGEIVALLKEATVHTLNLTEAQRKNYLQQQAVAGATAKNMGLQVDSIEQLRTALLTSDEAGAHFLSLLRTYTGYTGGVNALLQNPQLLLEETQKLAKATAGPGGVWGNVNQSREQMRTFQAVAGPATLTPEFLLRMAQDTVRTGEGTGGTPEELMAQMQQQAQGTIKATSDAMRGTAAEQADRVQASIQEGLIVPGTKLVEDFAKATNKFDQLLDKGIAAFDRLDQRTGGKLSTGIARVVEAQAAWAVARGVGKGLGALGVPVPKGLTAENPLSGLGRQFGVGKPGGMLEMVSGGLIGGGLWWGANKLGLVENSPFDVLTKGPALGIEGTPTSFGGPATGVVGTWAAPQAVETPITTTQWTTPGTQVGSYQTTIEPQTNSVKQVADAMTEALAAQGGQTQSALTTVNEKKMAEAAVQMLKEQDINFDSRAARRYYEKVLAPLGVRQEAFDKAIKDEEAKKLPLGGMVKDAAWRTLNPVGAAVGSVKDLMGLFKHEPDELLQMDAGAATHKNLMNVYKAVMEKQGYEVRPATPEEVEGPSWFDKMTAKFSSDTKPQVETAGAAVASPMDEVAQVGKQQKSILEEMVSYLRTIADNTSSTSPNPVPTSRTTPGDMLGWDYYAEAELGR